LLVPGGQPRVRLALALIVMTLIGLSRPMLGVHWPSDVMGGWMIGMSYAVFGAALVKNWEGKR
jgi:undecaprenyl-diphosphatase